MNLRIPPTTLNLPDGWLTDDEARELQSLAKGKLVLEIGAYLGRSTIAMALSARHVVSIDHHRGSPEHQPGQAYHDPKLRDGYRISTLKPFCDNLIRYGVADKVSVIIANTRNLQADLLAPIFDLAFVDGEHDFDNAFFDGSLAMHLVHEGGEVVFHDYTGWPGVKQAIKKFPGHRFTLRAGSMASLKV
jgi:hypothetical protein